MSVAIDRDRLWRWFESFVAADTLVPGGENRVDPLDPRLARFAHHVAAPAFEELGGTVEVDRLNNAVASFGQRTGEELLLLGYPALHHGNEMQDPLQARRVEGPDGRELWVGLGASQSKGGLAAICAAVAALRESGVDPAGRVLVGICSEGSSTHESSTVLYESLDPLPAGAVLTVGTRNQISLGNRGRVGAAGEILVDAALKEVVVRRGPGEQGHGRAEF